ncbi:MAG: ribonuclease III, partial [Chloroflexota bacterium]|nr:ribonuclease III [Chloroflexota bacterium]
MAEMTSSERLTTAASTTESAVGVSANAARTAALPFGLPDPVGEQALQARLGLHFADPMLLRLALTHRSVLPDWADLPDIEARRESNERLEFLGDALLGAYVAEVLFHRDPAASEGALTRRRAAIVRAETLVRWAREVDLGNALYLGTGERVSEAARDKMLAGGFEALVGAVALDQGRAAAERFIDGFLQRDIDAILASEEGVNPKGRLQEVAQELTGVAPAYVTVATEGPDHARHFTVAVTLRGEELGVGHGRSKREAQQAAAREALAVLAARRPIEGLRT